MGILGKLFGSDKAIEKTTEGIFSGIDKAILTKEETLDIRMKFMKLYEPFKIAQRLLALTFGIPYALAWFITFCMSFKEGIDLTVQMQILKGDMGTIVLVIVGFYFAGGITGNLIDRRKK